MCDWSVMGASMIIVGHLAKEEAAEQKVNDALLFYASNNPDDNAFDEVEEAITYRSRLFFNGAVSVNELDLTAVGL